MQKYILVALAAFGALVAGYWLFGREFSEEQASAGNGGYYAYVTEASSADECEADEEYDPAEGGCVYECESEAECAELANAAEEEMASWGDELEKDTTPMRESGSGDEKAESDSEASYRVSPGEVIALASGSAAPDHPAIWKQIAALSPDTFSDRYIEIYDIFRNVDDDTLAYVDDEDGNGKWRVAVNAAGYADSSDRERATTLIHELGHIVTLNSAQVSPGGDESSCSGFFTGEGCAAPSSYIASFVREFWPASDILAVGGGAGENESGLYERKSSNFVTEYAATNPGEDIAESFALFVLDKKIESPQTIAQKKTAFFYGFSDLVSFREAMRQGIIRGIVRARHATVK